MRFLETGVSWIKLMLCPSCGHENRAERLFCSECGQGLGVRCSTCDASNEPAEKYCGNCGGALPTPPAALTARASPTLELPKSFAAGRYQVRRLLGEGGAKRVYLARDTKLDSDVAIALIKTEGLDHDGLTRVRREAKAMANDRGDGKDAVAFPATTSPKSRAASARCLLSGCLTGRIVIAPRTALELVEAPRDGKDLPAIW